MFAERLNQAKGPVTMMIPAKGFSQHIIRETTDLAGNVVGSWNKPDEDKRFTDRIASKLTTGEVKVLELHINDQAFADACVDEFLGMIKA